MKFLVTLERDEAGFIVVECPALPGCVSQGRTEAEALANIREAIEASLETRREHGIPTQIEVAEVEIKASAG
jgi:predicted RNase H-like HicB family nuclease